MDCGGKAAAATPLSSGLKPNRSSALLSNRIVPVEISESLMNFHACEKRRGATLPAAVQDAPPFAARQTRPESFRVATAKHSPMRVQTFCVIPLRNLPLMCHYL